MFSIKVIFCGIAILSASSTFAGCGGGKHSPIKTRHAEPNGTSGLTGQKKKLHPELSGSTHSRHAFIVVAISMFGLCIGILLSLAVEQVLSRTHGSHNEDQFTSSEASAASESDDLEIIDIHAHQVKEPLPRGHSFLIDRTTGLWRPESADRGLETGIALAALGNGDRFAIGEVDYV